MAHVILGLLLLAPQSLYDLTRAFESAIGLFYSASSGSIKRALDNLLSQGQIEVDRVEPGRGRKVYRITDVGRAEFHAWMTGTPTGPNVETAALSRLFFLGLLREAERPAVLRGIIARIEDERARLVHLSTALDDVGVPPGMGEVFTHQRATLDYGLASATHAAEWFRAHLADVEGSAT